MRLTSSSCLGAIALIGLASACRTTSPGASAALETTQPGANAAADIGDEEGSNYWDVEWPAVAPADVEGAGQSETPPSEEEAIALTSAYASTFDMNDSRGQTYLTFMRNTVKPAIDKLAADGYKLGGAMSVDVAFNASASKIKNRVSGTWGGKTKVKSIASQLAGQTVTLNSLPGKVKSVAPGIDAYGLSSFLGLASGGGVNVKYAEQNYGLNVHYDVSNEQSGRSFGVGPTRGANDASDKDYLNGLEEYSRSTPDNLDQFYKAMFESLLDNNGSNYANVTPEGQTILTDFLAVFTAEQARNLMDGNVSPHWDAALMEVTMLASFHAGQSKMKLYYLNRKTGQTTFTDKTMRQKPCELPTSSQSASLVDYWQFSKNINSESSCRRSGINVTKREFRKLEEKITKYMSENHTDVLKKVLFSMGADEDSSNAFSALSYFLISDDTPESFPRAKVTAISDAWVEFLSVIRAEAKQITTFISQG